MAESSLLILVSKKNGYCQIDYYSFAIETTPRAFELVENYSEYLGFRLKASLTILKNDGNGAVISVGGAAIELVGAAVAGV